MGRAEKVLSKGNIRRTPTLIFLASGSSPRGFEELFIECDRIAILRNDLFFQAQIGGTVYKPTNYRYWEWLSHDEMLYQINTADIIISHAGFGIISECLEKRKKVIVVPRKGKGSYHSQESLAKYLETKGLLLSCTDTKYLESTIDKVFNYEIAPAEFICTIPNIVESFVKKISKK
jgi:UDP-N-acetylglucosamine transferase subunit ALG13